MRSIRCSARCFGTIYDISTVVILGFAGASAMAGLLNLVPQYLPRYGMAPEWARPVRPGDAVRDDQSFGHLDFRRRRRRPGGAYATGVLVLMSSACAGHGHRPLANGAASGIAGCRGGYLAITAIFFYTTAANMIERPDGIKIASWFIIAIVASSFWSRRATELGATVQSVRVCQLAFEVPLGFAQTPGVSGAGSASARAAGLGRERSQHPPVASTRRPTCRSCSWSRAGRSRASSSTAP